MTDRADLWKQIHVSFYVDLPVNATEEQVREWVKFQLRVGSVQIANPLSNHDLESAGYISIRKQA